ncbi:MAG: hypothetical protein ACRDRR_05850 [Pseudonocardiaceae bacterium]
MCGGVPPQPAFKRVSVYGRSWEACDEKITRLKADNYAGIGAAVSSDTVSQWLSYWLEDVVKPAVDLQTIRDLLGHSSIGVTSAIYVDVLREVQRDAIDRLGHLFGPDDETGATP